MPKCVKAADADASADDVENDDDADNTEHQGLRFFYDTRHNEAFSNNDGPEHPASRAYCASMSTCRLHLVAV